MPENSLQRKANGGVRKNAGDLTPELAEQIVAAVARTPLSLRASAYACGYQVADLKYLIKRGSLPGADPLWEQTSLRVRELIANAEAKNYARLDAAAEALSVSAIVEVQRQVEKDTWGVDPQPEDAPIVYDALFSDPNGLPADILAALIKNGWSHPELKESLDLTCAGAGRKLDGAAVLPDTAADGKIILRNEDRDVDSPGLDPLNE